MKRIFLVLGFGLVALTVALVAAGLHLGPIVKMGIEQGGIMATQVSVRVDTVGVGLLAGSATIKGLVVGNPPGYSTPQAFGVGTITMNLDPLSVISQKIVVHSVHVESPEITYEVGFGGNNLNTILNNVNAFVKANIHPSDKPAPKIEVEDFLITGAKVHVNISGLDKDIPIPDIHLTDLGKASDGLTPAELTSAILNVISTDTVTAVTSSADSTGKVLGTSVSQITSDLGGVFGK